MGALGAPRKDTTRRRAKKGAVTNLYIGILQSFPHLHNNISIDSTLTQILMSVALWPAWPNLFHAEVCSDLSLTWLHFIKFTAALLLK